MRGKLKKTLKAIGAKFNRFIGDCLKNFCSICDIICLFVISFVEKAFFDG